MLKQQRAVDDPAALYVDDRPRKKLSFREPEVVPQTTNGLPLSAPASTPSSKGHGRHMLTRPHSISGVFNLTGLSGAIASNVHGLGKKGGTSSHHLPSSPLPQLKNYIAGKMERGDRVLRIDFTDKTEHLNQSTVDRGDTRNRTIEECCEDGEGDILSVNDSPRSSTFRNKDSQQTRFASPKVTHHSSPHHSPSQQMSPQSEHRSRASHHTESPLVRLKKEPLLPQDRNHSPVLASPQLSPITRTVPIISSGSGRPQSMPCVSPSTIRSRSAEQHGSNPQDFRANSVSLENLNLDVSKR